MNDARGHEMLSALAVVDNVVFNGKAAHTKLKLRFEGVQPRDCWQTEETHW